MVITIDSAGTRGRPESDSGEQFNLTPGSRLKVETTADGITVRRADTEPTLVRSQGILVHHGAARAALDIGEFVRAERRARHARIARDSG